jgi:hypothetical protein
MSYSHGSEFIQPQHHRYRVTALIESGLFRYRTKMNFREVFVNPRDCHDTCCGTGEAADECDNTSSVCGPVGRQYINNRGEDLWCEDS